MSPVAAKGNQTLRSAKQAQPTQQPKQATKHTTKPTVSKPLEPSRQTDTIAPSPESLRQTARTQRRGTNSRGSNPASTEKPEGKGSGI